MTIIAAERLLVVASQLGSVLDGSIADLAANLDIRTVSRGQLGADAMDAEIVFAAPSHGSVARGWIDPPAGWPGNIKWIQLVSSGIDGYPRWLFDGAVVTNARGPSAAPMAEFALAAIFSAAKRMPQCFVTAPGQWEAGKFRGQDIAGSTLGLIGYGAIGRRIAESAVALGMRVVALRRTGEPFDVPGVARAADAGAVMAQADHVVLVAPATPATARMIDRNALANAKPGLHLINIARGSLIDDDALLEALDGGRVGQATLDVTDPEPLPAGHPFFTHPHIRLSPHISMSTGAAVAALIDKFLENLRRYRSGSPLIDIVDIERGY